MEKLNRQLLGKRKLALMRLPWAQLVQSRIVLLLTLLGNRRTMSEGSFSLPQTTEYLNSLSFLIPRTAGWNVFHSYSISSNLSHNSNEHIRSSCRWKNRELIAVGTWSALINSPCPHPGICNKASFIRMMQPGTLTPPTSCMWRLFLNGAIKGRWSSFKNPIWYWRTQSRLTWE